MSDPGSLEKVAARIAARAPVEPADIVSVLLDRAPRDRQRANLMLARAYAENGALDAATIFARRAFDVGDWNFEAFTLLHALLQAANRLRDAIDITREAMIMAADNGDIAQLYILFSLINDMGGGVANQQPPIPDPRADRIVAWIMARAFGCAPPPLRPDVLGGRKIRVGLMLAGDDFENSAVTRTALGFARHHNKDRFEVHVYSYQSLAHNRQKNPRTDAWLAEIESWGCTYHEGVAAAGLARVIATQKRILQDDLDIFFFNMVIKDLYILALMNPAPVVMGYIHGSPIGYTMRTLDGSISGDPHSQMESFAHSYLINSFIDFEILNSAAPGGGLGRAEIDIPDQATLIVSGGQPYKLDNKAFWQVVDQVLRARPQAVWLVVGIDQSFLTRNGFAPDRAVAARLKLLPWRKDYVENILPLADLIVDTFPAGGSLALFSGMRLGKPCVAFRAEQMQAFSSRNWSGAFALLGREDLAVARGDLAGFAARILALIDSPDERTGFGALCKTLVASLTNTRRYAHEMETAIVDAITRKQNQRAGASGR